MAISFVETGCFHSYCTQYWVLGGSWRFPLPPPLLPWLVGASPSLRLLSDWPKRAELVALATTARLGREVSSSLDWADTGRLVCACTLIEMVVMSKQATALHHDRILIILIL